MNNRGNGGLAKPCQEAKRSDKRKLSEFCHPQRPRRIGTAVTIQIRSCQIPTAHIRTPQAIEVRRAVTVAHAARVRHLQPNEVAFFSWSTIASCSSSGTLETCPTFLASKKRSFEMCRRDIRAQLPMPTPPEDSLL